MSLARAKQRVFGTGVTCNKKNSLRLEGLRFFGLQII